MIEQAILGGAGAEGQAGSPPNETLPLQQLRPAMGRRVEVREIFARFQNLNLRVLIEDLRRGPFDKLTADGDWPGVTWPSLSETRRSRLGETHPRARLKPPRIRGVGNSAARSSGRGKHDARERLLP